MELVEIPDATPSGWARNTGPCVPQSARRFLIYLAENCDAETGAVRVTYRTMAGNRRLGANGAKRSVDELMLAGLITFREHGDEDRRRNVYTLAAAETGWVVTAPFVRYNRHEYYRLHRRVAELAGLLQAASPGSASCGGRCKTGRLKGAE